MRAVIMAGGQGSRLRPLTERCPKPMARLCGRPILEYILELLAENGVDECLLTLQYLPEQIRSHFPDSSYAGMRLQFFEEQQPLGTAGSVRQALGEPEDPVLVISGDALCDFPLRQAINAHQNIPSAVTLVSAQVEDPREYGLVIANKTGRITGFVEKPSFAQATSELANTGIYLLSPEAVRMIPADKPYDFASDLFPALLAAGERMQNCTLPGYWCDIGDLAAYRKAQRDLLDGRVHCRLRGQRDANGNLLAGRRPTGHFELEAPVFIGEGVHIGERAVIGAGSVLDDGVTVAGGATIGESVLLPRAFAGERAGMLSALLCADASLKSGACLLEGAAAGEGAVIGAKAVVRAGVRICAGACVPDGTILADHLKAGMRGDCAFDDDGLCGEVGVELTPELAVRVGCAVGSIARGRTVGVASEDSRASQTLAAALIAGIRSTGAGVLDFGGAFEALFGFAMHYNALSLGVYLRAGEPGAIKLLGDAGLPATRLLERAVEQTLTRGEFVRAARDGFGERVDMAGIGVIYLTELLRLAPDGLSGMAATVRSQNPAIRRILTDLLGKLGCESGGILLDLPENGLSLTLSQGDTVIGRHRAVTAYCNAQFALSRDVAVENDFPRALDRVAAQHGRRVYRYLRCPADESDRDSRVLAAGQRCARDGLMLAVALLDEMRRRGLSLQALDRSLEPFAVEEQRIPIDLPPARLLAGFPHERVGEGVLVHRDRGVVLLRPGKRGDAIRLFAEAANWETAHELCGELTREISALLDKQRENK